MGFKWWPGLHRNGGLVWAGMGGLFCSGMSGLVCIGIVAYFAPEWEFWINKVYTLNKM